MGRATKLIAVSRFVFVGTISPWLSQKSFLREFISDVKLSAKDKADDDAYAYCSEDGFSRIFSNVIFSSGV